MAKYKFIMPEYFTNEGHTTPRYEIGTSEGEDEIDAFKNFNGETLRVHDPVIAYPSAIIGLKRLGMDKKSFYWRNEPIKIEKLT